MPLSKARDTLDGGNTKSNEDLKVTLAHLSKSVPTRDTDLYTYRPDQKVEFSPPFAKNDCPDKVESWRMEGEINELLSVALAEPKLSLFPVPDASINPDAIRSGHVYAALEHVNRAHTFEGRLEGVRGNVLQAMARTKLAMETKSKPESPDTVPTAQADEEQDTLLDCDMAPATSFLSISEGRVRTSKRSMRRESPSSRSSSSSSSNTWCTSALSKIIHMDVVNSTLTSDEAKTFVKLACTWYEKRNDITACQRLEIASQSLVAAAKRRKDLRDYDCVTSNETAVCAGHGICHCSMCYCENGFGGISCETKTCKGGCGLHGYCVDGTCRCSSGWIGKSCQIKDCGLGEENKERCSGHGLCSTDHIPEEFEGQDSKAKNLQDALDHTEMTAPKAHCLCAGGWSGETCSHKSCPFATSEASTQEMCSGEGHGTCDLDKGQCECSDSFKGKACEICVDTSHMSCVVGDKSAPREGVTSTLNPNCRCHEGYTGICCTRVACANSCSGHGSCDGAAGKCICEHGWFSPDCSKPRPTCGSDGGCGEHGICVGSGDGTCICESGYKGDHCTLDDCPKNCLAPVRGVCDDNTGSCKCRAGFSGRDCSEVVEIDDDCAGDCSDFCTHHTECTYDDQDVKILNAAVRSSSDPDDTAAVSFLELGKTVQCYWGCMRQCVRDKCV